MAEQRSRTTTGGRSSDFARRAQRLRRELAELVRDLALMEEVPLEGPDGLESLELRLRIGLTPGAEDGAPEGGGHDPLLVALLAELRAVREESGLLTTGRVYCFQCRSSACAHAAPEGDRDVFFEYSATGKPVWRELTEACLAWREPRVGELYGDSPAVVAVQRRASELTAELMRGFGRGERGYRLLGQVAVGYLPFGGGERGALTLQVIGTRRGSDRLRLHLNVVGTPHGVAGGRGYPAWWERKALRETVHQARLDLQSLALRLEGRKKGPLGPRVAEGVDAALGRLRASLERLYRPQDHRTRHAQERKREGGRPTHVAVADAERASDERLFYEPDRDTVVVVGPKGRVHVFAEDGRHVTSLYAQREAIERKLDRKQWVPCERARRDRFRAAIAALRANRRD